MGFAGRAMPTSRVWPNKRQNENPKETEQDKKTVIMKRKHEESEVAELAAGREMQVKTSRSVEPLLQKYEACSPDRVLRGDGIRALDVCENNCELLRHYDSASSEYYRDNIGEFAELSMRYGHLLRSGAMCPLGVRHFGDGLRYGLVSLLELQKDDFVGQYSGVIQVSDGGLAYGERYSSDYAWDYPDFPADWPDIEVSAQNAGNALRYVNHSFEPNCRVEHTLLDGFWVLFFLADCQIPAGTQLLVNYGVEYWSNGMRELLHI